MADKKKFEKPQMKAIKLNLNNSVLISSGCLTDIYDIGCPTHA